MNPPHATLTCLLIQTKHFLFISLRQTIRHSSIIPGVPIDCNHVQHGVTDGLVFVNGHAAAAGPHEHGRVVVHVLDDDLRRERGAQAALRRVGLVRGGDDDRVLGVHLVVDGVPQCERARVLVDGEGRARRLLADAVPVEGRRGMC